MPVSPIRKPDTRLDQQCLSEIYRGDSAFAAEMFGIFLEEMVPLFPGLARHAAAKNWPALAALAHKLKPSALLVGLPQLDDALELIQNRARRPEFQPKLAQLVEQILLTLEQSVPEIQQEFHRLTEKQA